MSTPFRPGVDVVMADLGGMHAANVAGVNARTVADSLCVLHSDYRAAGVPATHVIRVPIGNDLTVCRPCLDWWLQEWLSSSPDADWLSIRRLS